VPRKQIAIIAAALTCFCVFGATLCAQPPVVTPAAPATKPSNPLVDEAKPDLFYVRDKDGKLQPVLGFTLDEFDRLISQDQARQQGPLKPTFRVDKLVISGAARGTVSELKIRFTIFIDADDWVRVPLRLSGMVLREAVTYQGPGQYRLDFDEQADEYIGWLRGKGDKPHVLEVTAVTPLTTVAGETRLKLNLPRAWSSELTFLVPVLKAIGQVSPGAAIDTIRTVKDGTEFRVLGVGSDFHLTWRETTARPENLLAVLEATGAVSARIDGRSLSTRTQLTVRSLGGEFDTFRVRLPKNAILIAEPSTQYTIEAEKPATNKKDAIVVRVQLKARTTGPVDVELLTEQPTPVGDKPTPVEFSGFEVIGAVRQWGHVAVEIDGDWQLLWDQRKMVRQVDALPSELETDEVVAGFEYFAQPFQLSARVVPKESRIRVAAQHLILMHGDHAELETRLKYRIAGARVHSLQVDLADWVIDDVEPDTLVDGDQLVTSQRAPLSIPLRQGTAGEFEVVLRGRLEFANTAEPIRFAIPKPRVSALAPALVVIVPDDEVDVQVQDTGTLGLVRQYSRPPIELPQRQQAALVFQTTGEAATLTARVQSQQRSVATNVDVQIHVGATQLDVTSRLNLQIARQAIDHVMLQLPSALMEGRQLEIALEDQPLTWTVLAETQGETDVPARVRVALPQAKIGALGLQIRYNMPLDKPLTDAPLPMRIPLVMPAEGEFRGADVVLASASGVRCQSADGFWSTSEDSAKLKLKSQVPRTEVTVGLMSVPETRVGTIVERAWLQTYLTQQGRFDRAVYSLSSKDTQLRVTLPSHATAVEMWRGGARIQPTVDRSAIDWLVPLDRNARGLQCLEIVYRIDDEQVPQLVGPHTLVGPRFGPGVVTRQTYWQVVTPSENHLVSCAGPVTSEHVWDWSGWRWGRTPLLNQADLESWCGATAQSPVPEHAHQYLFQSRTDLNQITVVTSRRSLLVLLGAGSALVLGYALVYWRGKGRIGLLLVVALLATAAGLIFPEPALVVGQAAAPGILLALVASFLRRKTSRRTAPSVITRGSPSSVVERASTRTHVPTRPATSSVGSSTATLQLGEAAAARSGSSLGNTTAMEVRP